MVLASPPLAGRHIVVTRPAGQAAHLATTLAGLGAQPVLYPVLAIAPLTDVTPLLEVALRLDQFQLAAFVSPNAIEQSLAAILPRRPWPATLRIAAIGKSSEQTLDHFGLHADFAPTVRFDSEALLEHPGLQAVQGWKVLIFRGDGGREVLGDTLRERGASIEYITCYRRSCPDLSPAPLMKLWSEHRLDAVTVTSSEGLRNLFEMIGALGQAWLKKPPVVVPHARIAEQAQRLGLQPVISTGPGDEGLVAGLLQYFRP